MLSPFRLSFFFPPRAGRPLSTGLSSFYFRTRYGRPRHAGTGGGRRRSSAINLSSPRRGLSLEYHTPQRSERSASRRQVAALISTYASGMVNAIVRDRDRGAQPAGTH